MENKLSVRRLREEEYRERLKKWLEKRKVERPSKKSLSAPKTDSTRREMPSSSQYNMTVAKRARQSIGVPIRNLRNPGTQSYSGSNSSSKQIFPSYWKVPRTTGRQSFVSGTKPIGSAPSQRRESLNEKPATYKPGIDTRFYVVPSRTDSNFHKISSKVKCQQVLKEDKEPEGKIRNVCHKKKQNFEASTRIIKGCDSDENIEKLGIKPGSGVNSRGIQRNPESSESKLQEGKQNILDFPHVNFPEKASNVLVENKLKNPGEARKQMGILKFNSSLKKSNPKKSMKWSLDSSDIKEDEENDTRSENAAQVVRFLLPEFIQDDSSHATSPTTKSPAFSNKDNLETWLEETGRTPTKFRHLMCFTHHADAATNHNNEPLCKRFLSKEELLQQEAVIKNESQETATNQPDKDGVFQELHFLLEECRILFESGCPLSNILSWLDQIQQRIAMARHSALFWITKLRAVKAKNDLIQFLDVFEDAIKSCAQPADLLATALSEMIRDLLKNASKYQNPDPTDQVQEVLQKRKSTPRRLSIQTDTMFASSSIKYSVHKLMPFKKRKIPVGMEGITLPFTVVTPVRRSTRKRSSILPATQQVYVYDNLKDLPAPKLECLVYQENDALDIV